MENGCLYMYDGKNFHNMCWQINTNVLLYNHQMKVRYTIWTTKILELFLSNSFLL
jgi:hypothetical protein